MKQKVLYISQEISPYLSESPMAVQGRDLPQAVQEKGFEVRTFMPKYGSINERRNQLHEVIRLSGKNIIIDDTDHPLIIKVATLQPTRMQVYFIDNDDFFHKFPCKGLETDTDPAQNDERMMFFTRGVVETVKKLRWEPAIINCMGWITAMHPAALRTLYHEDPAFASARIVYALRPEDFEGTLDPRFQEKLRQWDVAPETLKALGTEPVTAAALHRFAMDYADAIVLDAPGVDPELIAYAEATGKPFLRPDYDGDVVQQYADFYHSLLGADCA
ncbi:MAG: glycogen/starch synthase [Bacteroidales bacterium]|nr:glycogen/starch synthase [Bacteroidales bacterium]